MARIKKKELGQIIKLPTLWHVMCLRKYKATHYICGHSVLDTMCVRNPTGW